MDQFKKAAGDAMKGGPKIPPGVGKGIGAVVGIAAGLGLTAYGAYHSMISVRPGHLGIVYNRFGIGNSAGIQNVAVLGEGLNFVIPWFQRPMIFDVRTRPKLINSISGSKDLQMVEISLRVLFRPNPSDLPFIYRRLGYDFEERVLPSVVNEVTKAVIAQYNASELLTKREEVSKKVRDFLTTRAGDFKILIDDVSITHLAFSSDYTAAVEAKQVAQQEAEQAKYVVERALQEKKSIVIKAEGEAQSAKLIGKAISENPAFLQLRKIDAAKEVASTVSKSNSQIYISSDTLLLNGLGEVTENKAAGKKK